MDFLPKETKRIPDVFSNTELLNTRYTGTTFFAEATRSENVKSYKLLVDGQKFFIDHSKCSEHIQNHWISIKTLVPLVTDSYNFIKITLNPTRTNGTYVDGYEYTNCSNVFYRAREQQCGGTGQILLNLKNLEQGQCILEVDSGDVPGQEKKFFLELQSPCIVYF